MISRRRFFALLIAAAAIIAASFIAASFFRQFNAPPSGIAVYWGGAPDDTDGSIDEVGISISGGFTVSKAYLVASGGAEQLRFRIMGSGIGDITGVSATVGDVDVTEKTGLIQQKIMGIKCLEVFVGLKEPGGERTSGEVRVRFMNGDSEVGVAGVGVSENRGAAPTA